ncbi:hypothetical protein SAMN06269185_2125 [Natronoarchaeum philippinense]|uniref:Small CPxCG-related zinc finger protein n=1 Tax=Natronoarchaeum philippinense TaxID=558529 RepID=A0A285NWC0_NATPI|nr:hypothetical protein [Natronoarchaeum philippinense]SNZ13337.1 hypothetical protein SAMN06269185_2125 [Natronoarchaeum philippinense]
MDCPRCGERLIHYSLGDSETWSCRRCSYSGITVEHRSDRPDPESWEESFRRFYEQRANESSDRDSGEREQAQSTDADSPAPDQCVAATASGSRCSRDAVPGERYCSQHRKMAAGNDESVVDHE